MNPLSRPARLLAAIAALSFAGIVLVYAFPPHDRPTLALVTGVCWLWASAYAAYCCMLAARRIMPVEERRTWQWIGAGCLCFFAGQVYWTINEVALGVTPTFPSLADIGYLSIYVCFALGVTTMLRAQPTRRPDPELILDTVLVTFMAGALAYAFLLEPLFDAGGSLLALFASI